MNKQTKGLINIVLVHHDIWNHESSSIVNLSKERCILTYAEAREGRSKSNDEPPGGENKVEQQYKATPDHHHHLSWCLNRQYVISKNLKHGMVLQTF